MHGTLQNSLSSGQRFAPKLQQSVRLLGLSALEFAAEVEQALAENPFLERLDDPFCECPRITPEGFISSAQSESVIGDAALAGNGCLFAPSSLPSDPPVNLPDPDLLESVGSGEMEGGEGYLTERSFLWEERSEPGGLEQLQCSGLTLREHLWSQLNMVRAASRCRALVGVLIEFVCETGFLEHFLPEIAEFLSDGTTEAELLEALEVLQQFEPTGVGARDLRECLLLQANDSDITENWPKNLRQLAIQTIDRHLVLLADRKFSLLGRILGCSVGQVEEVARYIRRYLNPKPGLLFSDAEVPYAIPDVLVRKSSVGWLALPNDSASPKVALNPDYARIIQGRQGALDTTRRLEGYLAQARWWVESAAWRAKTIFRVAQEIVRRQAAFFQLGAAALGPLTLGDVAESLGLSLSTVSRVTSRKYMLTPFGLLELKSFFEKPVRCRGGEVLSGAAVHSLIHRLISRENAGRPISDREIAHKLQEQGVLIARRTVSDYRRRESGLPPASTRRVSGENASC